MNRELQGFCVTSLLLTGMLRSCEKKRLTVISPPNYGNLSMYNFENIRRSPKQRLL